MGARVDDDLDVADLTGQAASLCEGMAKNMGRKRGCLFYGIIAFVALWLCVFCGGFLWFIFCAVVGIKVGTDVYNAPKTQEFLHGEKPAAVKTLEKGEAP